MEHPTQNALVPVAARAAVALDTLGHEIALRTLAATAKGITAITNADGLKECHATRMTLKNTRIAITRLGKDARDDAQAFAKAVIEEERRLIAIIQPEEDRLNTLQTDYEAAIEAEKQRQSEAEAARVQAIRDRIEAIRQRPAVCIGKPSADIRSARDEIAATVIDDRFSEHAALAQMAKDDALAKLDTLLTATLANEAEQTRLATEREELARQRAELQRQQDELRAREQAEQRRREADEAAAREAKHQEDERQRQIASQQRELDAAEDSAMTASPPTIAVEQPTPDALPTPTAALTPTGSVPSVTAKPVAVVPEAPHPNTGKTVDSTGWKLVNEIRNELGDMNVTELTQALAAVRAIKAQRPPKVAA